MTILALFLLAYLFVAPDKGSLALTRGTAGAVRGLLGMGGSSRTAKTAASKGRSGASGGRGAGELKRSILDGWREGTASARQVREEGRDLWSRGTRVSGRVAGGTRSLVVGARTTIRNRRDRRDQTDIPDQDVSPIDVPTADPSPIADDDVHAGLKQHLDDSADPAGPADRSGQQDGELLFSSKNDDLGAAIGDLAPEPEQKAGEANKPGVDQVVDDVVPTTAAPVAEEPPADDRRYYVWKSPVSGQFFMFDRMNLDDPLKAPTKADADVWTEFYNGRHELATEGGFAATPLTPFPAGAGPDRHRHASPPAASQTPVTAPATGNPTTSTTTRKETSMAIAGTELGNLDEVDSEAKTALAAIEALTEALNEIKGWGNNLPDRWAGTAWSTDGLDAAVAGVAEEAAELKIPEGLMERLGQIGAEVKKARTVGEAAAEAKAKGDLSGFIPA